MPGRSVAAGVLSFAGLVASFGSFEDVDSYGEATLQGKMSIEEYCEYLHKSCPGISGQGNADSANCRAFNNYANQGICIKPGQADKVIDPFCFNLGSMTAAPEATYDDSVPPTLLSKKKWCGYFKDETACANGYYTISWEHPEGSGTIYDGVTPCAWNAKKGKCKKATYKTGDLFYNCLSGCRKEKTFTNPLTGSEQAWNDLSDELYESCGGGSSTPSDDDTVIDNDKRTGLDNGATFCEASYTITDRATTADPTSDAISFTRCKWDEGATLDNHYNNCQSGTTNDYVCSAENPFDF